MPKMSPLSLDSALRQAISQALHPEFEALRREIAALRADLARRPAAAPARAAGAGRARRQKRGGKRSAGSLSASQVKAIRTRLGVTQRRLATLASVTPVAVYFWESGRTTPSLEKEAILLRLAKASPEAAPAASARKPAKKRAGSKTGAKK